MSAACRVLTNLALHNNLLADCPVGLVLVPAVTREGDREELVPVILLDKVC